MCEIDTVMFIAHNLALPVSGICVVLSEPVDGADEMEILDRLFQTSHPRKHLIRIQPVCIEELDRVYPENGIHSFRILWVGVEQSVDSIPEVLLRHPCRIQFQEIRQFIHQEPRTWTIWRIVEKH